MLLEFFLQLEPYQYHLHKKAHDMYVYIEGQLILCRSDTRNSIAANII